MRKRDLSRPSSISGTIGISIPRPAKKRVKTTAAATFTPSLAPQISPALLTEVVSTITVEAVKVVPPASSASSLPDLVKKFGQIKTKLQSPPTSFKSHLLQNARQIFEDWVKRDFTSSFSLKILCDPEKALIELYKAQLLSKAQYESFLSFFENLQALRDQHHKAEWAFNRVKCF